MSAPSLYTEVDLGLLARNEARAHSKANGGGRAVGIHWTVWVGTYGVALEVSYVANRPDGNCGRYSVRVAL